MSMHTSGGRRFRVGLMAVALAFVATVGLGSAAHAAEGTIPNNPWGCKMYALNSHKSGGMGSSHGGIQGCSSAPAELFVSVTVQKQGWAQWHNMSTHTGFKTNTTAKLDVNSKFVCSNSVEQNYRTQTDVRVSTSNNTHYFGTIRSTENRYACDRP